MQSADSVLHTREKIPTLLAEVQPLVAVLPDFELPVYEPTYMLYAASDDRSPKLEALQRALLRVAAGQK